VELLLVVTCQGRTPVDVRVETDPASPGAELVAALRDVTGSPDDVEGWVVRTCSRIAPDQPVSAAGLVHGDRVELTPPGRAPADLTTADLTAADLTDADLTDANLADVNLRGADLTDANLTDANLYRADLTGADLTGVIWSNTTCPDGTNSNRHANTCVGYGI
jgi:uncharacterized protein YjbI with pentapeptide repeats